MAFKLEIDKPFAGEIPRIARERVERVIESLSEKPQPSAESIHSARKDLKSLRALLRLARGAITEETRRSENIIFRDTGRSLSALRDSQALVEALKKFVKGKIRTSPKSPETQKKARLDFIQKVRSQIEHEALKDLPEETLKQLREKLRGTIQTVAHWFDRLSFEPADEWEVFMGRGLRRTYRQGKRIVSQLESLGKENAGDETWHEFRKSAKALGYQLRVLRPVWPELLEVLLEEADRLTDKLGDDHDLAVLRSRFLAEPYNPTETQGAADMRRDFIDSLDRRRRKLQLEAYRIAGRIYAEKPRQFERRICCYWNASQPKRARIGAQVPRKRTGSTSKTKAAPRPSARPVRSFARRRLRPSNTVG